MHDLIIRSADLYDGTGQPRCRGEIAIANGPTGVGLRPRPRTEPVADLPGGAAPVLQRPTGIAYVIVNGEPLLERGSPTEARRGTEAHRGQVLRGA